MDLVGVSVREGLAALLTLQRLVRGVELLHVDLEVCLPAARGWAQLTLEHGLVARVDQFVGFQ